MESPFGMGAPWPGTAMGLGMCHTALLQWLHEGTQVHIEPWRESHPNGVGPGMKSARGWTRQIDPEFSYQVYQQPQTSVHIWRLQPTTL